MGGLFRTFVLAGAVALAGGCHFYDGGDGDGDRRPDGDDMWPDCIDCEEPPPDEGDPDRPPGDECVCPDGTTECCDPACPPEDPTCTEPGCPAGDPDCTDPECPPGEMCPPPDCPPDDPACGGCPDGDPDCWPPIPPECPPDDPACGCPEGEMCPPPECPPDDPDCLPPDPGGSCWPDCIDGCYECGDRSDCWEACVNFCEILCADPEPDPPPGDGMDPGAP